MEKIYEHLNDLHVRNVVAYVGSDNLLYKNDALEVPFTKDEIVDLFMKNQLLVKTSNKMFKPTHLHVDKLDYATVGVCVVADGEEADAVTAYHYYSGEYDGEKT